MTLTVGADTYATLAEADAYASDMGWTDWTASDAVKESALRQATHYLDTSYDWLGSISDTAQVLAWPRTGVVDREGREIAVDAIPATLKYAQIELAKLGIGQALVASASSGDVSAIQAGSVSITFSKGQTASETTKFAWVDRLLSGLFKSRSGGRLMNVKLARA